MEQDITTFQFTVQLLNSFKPGDAIAKTEIKKLFIRQFQQKNGLTTVYTYLSMFLRAGYIHVAKSPGFYILDKNVKDEIQLGELRNEWHLYKEHVKEIATHEHIPDANAYDPIRLICECKMSYLQGCILMSLNDIELVKQYAELAVFYNHRHEIGARVTKNIYDYIDENKIGDSEATIISQMVNNNYNNVIKICDNMHNNLLG